MRRHLKKAVYIALAIGVFLLLFSTFVSAERHKIYLATIDGAISPATADYFDRALEKATEDKAQLLILQLNTPGGLDKSMRHMIQVILDSSIPIVTYVSPKGARAASAGTYIVYASHVAAMADATNLGSATPVSIGLVEPPKQDGQKDTKESSAKQTMDAMQRKMINDAKAYIKGLAQLRERNQEWAEQAVESAANLPAKDALEKQVINIIAYDLEHLIKQLHGKQIKLNKETITLDVAESELVVFDSDWRTELLIIITDPSIAYLLLLAGIYGLMFEFLNPGSLLPGTLGAICLLVALYALNMLPINYAGLALLLLGIGLMVAEAFAPSFGILGMGGIAAFSIGSFMLLDSEVPGYQIAPALIVSTSIASAVLLIFIVSMIIKSRRSPEVSGQKELINHTAIATESFDGLGRVMIRGEVWQAISEQPISKSQQVKVVAIDGLTLKIKPEE
ncbi:MAG: nodulation protein NfeD [Kangiellaceae bacterium]|nr:nodulation protein NfeD [Kangiellaceae bacterium]MCW9000037.1 nodulation protein NfeD [Kangiellaceae bacterium]